MENDLRTCPVSDAKTVTLSDTVDLSMEDRSAEDLMKENRYCRGFHSNATGTLAVLFPKNDTVISLVVLEGGSYPYIVRRFMSTGTDSGLIGKIIALR